MLTILAYLIVAALTPFGIAWAVLFHFKKLSGYFKQFAIGLDQLGNVTCQFMLNFFLITKEGQQFGDEDRTVSYVLGVNKKNGTLTRHGTFWCEMLNKMDEEHVEDAIESENKKSINQ